MKYSLQKRISAFVLAFALVMTTAFNSVGVTTANAAALKCKSLKANKSSVSVVEGSSVKVTVTQKFNKKSAAKISVTSSDKSVATVSKKLGKKAKSAKATLTITGVAAGTATITVKSTKKTKKTKKIKVTVKAKETATTAAPATTQASADATTALPADVKVESLLLDKSEASVMVGDSVTLTATKTPAAAQAAVTWTSSDTKIATVKDGVVTGVAEGTATITAEADGKKAEAKITVTKKEIVATLTGAEQKTANQIALLFDTAEASKLIGVNDIKVLNVSSNANVSLSKLEFNAGGNSATATLSTPFVNGSSYEISYKDAKFTFTASVGAVASIVIDTDSAELNTATPIKFRLMDAASIDVTSTVNVDSYVTVSFTGDYSNKVDAKASKSSVTFDAVGAKAEVTVTYDKGDGKSDPVVGVKTITCVPAKAVVGDKVYYVGTDVNTKSGCAKFYNGLKTDKPIEVAVDGTVSNIFFYADVSGEAAAYDSYEVEAADVERFTVTKDSSDDMKRYVQLSVSGLTVGESSINIKATKNDATTLYTIPVSVVKVGELTNLELTPAKGTISNSNDANYSETITIKPIVKAGFATPTDLVYSAKIKEDITRDASFDANGLTSTVGVSVSGNKVTLQAGGVTNTSLTVEVSTTDPTTGKDFTKPIKISVKQLDGNFWDGNANVTYDLETSAKSVKLSTYTAPTVKLYAKVGSLFAGYVDATSGKIGGTNVTGVACKNIASSTATQATGGKFLLQISSASHNVRPNGLVYVSADGASANATSVALTAIGATATFAPLATDNEDVIPVTFGAVKKFTVLIKFLDSNNTVVEKSVDISFTNDFKAPTIKNVTKSISDAGDVKHCFTSSNSLNNNDLSDEIVNVKDKDGAILTSAGTAQFVTVHENYKTNNVNFITRIGSSKLTD